MTTKAPPPALLPQPCFRCGAPVVWITAGTNRIALDPRQAVYSRESDGEGGCIWLRIDDGKSILARHTCRGEN